MRTRACPPEFAFGRGTRGCKAAPRVVRFGNLLSQSPPDLGLSSTIIGTKRKTEKHGGGGIEER